MRAQYAGTCSACWVGISPGNRVQKHPTLGWVHDNCYYALLEAKRRKEAAKAKDSVRQLSLFK